MRNILYIYLLCASFIVNAQKNQFDSNNKRHGLWVKKFKNGNIRYQGKFNHGKEIGIFKFYSLTSSKNPSIVKNFNDNDNTSTVQFYTLNGKLISKGQMDEKKRIGAWVYFHKNGKTILQKEFYVNGKLNGKYVTYFSNNKPTIETHYKNGKLNGTYKRYAIKGHIYQNFNYKNGLREGNAIFYDRVSGNLIKKGQFSNDLKTGNWNYYKNNKLIETKNFSPEN